MNLQERNVDIREIIIIPLRRIGDADNRVLVVFFELGLESPSDKSTTDDTYCNLVHFQLSLKC